MQVALRYLICALIGAVVFVILGYFVTGRDFSFGFWIERPIRYNVHLWALLGLIVGAGIRFAR